MQKKLKDLGAFLPKIGVFCALNVTQILQKIKMYKCIKIVLKRASVGILLSDRPVMKVRCAYGSDIRHKSYLSSFIRCPVSYLRPKS